jgi:branched-chain amino acid transport system permease protein
VEDPPIEILVQQLTGGLAVGCVYALVALGFTMMLRATDLVNFAQGEFLMTGAYFGYTLLSLTPLPFLAVFVVASLLTGVLGMVVEMVALRPIRLRQSPVLNLIIATVGIGIVLRLLAMLVWGAEPLRYPARMGEGALLIAGLPLSREHVWIIVLAASAMLVLHVFFQRTLHGVAWRAAAYDAATAEILGIGFSRVVTLTFGISAALAGAAGVLIAPLFFVAPDLWLLGPRAFAAAALGQFSILGTMIGGPILGVLETLGAGYVSSAYKNGIAYGITIVVLMMVAVPRMPAGSAVAQRYRRVSLAESLGWSNRAAARWRRAAGVIGVPVALVLPLALDEYAVHVLTLIVIYMVAALGLQLVIGFGGSIVVGHAAFVGAGAYASALLSVQVGLPFPLALGGAAIVAALLGLLFGPILRLPGHYCAIATLGFGEIVNLVMVNWTSVTNGMSGIGHIPQPRMGPWVIRNDYHFYYLALAVFALVFAALHRLVNSRFGRALMAARENELAATAMGISVSRQRARAFAIGAACAGVTGSLFAHFATYISPDSFTLVDSIAFLTMVVLGGLGSLPGAALGALIVTGLPETLRTLAEYRILVYGVLLVVFMMFLPGGLADLLPRLAALARGVAPVPVPATTETRGGDPDR